MDSIILSFTEKQYKKYQKLKACAEYEHIKLEFDFNIGAVAPFKIEDAISLIGEIKVSALSLLQFEHTGSVFFTPLSKEEISKLVPMYFAVVKQMDIKRLRLYSILSNMHLWIRDLETRQVELGTSYADFLPYKAALFDKDDYREKINHLDFEYRRTIASISKIKETEIQKCASFQKICDVIIPEFFASSAKTADSPKFESFDTKEFFRSVRVFAERLDNLML